MFITKIKNLYQEEKKFANEFWLIFDKDEAKDDDFNNAINMAEKKGDYFI